MRVCLISLDKSSCCKKCYFILAFKKYASVNTVSAKILSYSQGSTDQFEDNWHKIFGFFSMGLSQYYTECPKMYSHGHCHASLWWLLRRKSPSLTNKILATICEENAIADEFDGGYQMTFTSMLIKALHVEALGARFTTSVCRMYLGRCDAIGCSASGYVAALLRIKFSFRDSRKLCPTMTLTSQPEGVTLLVWKASAYTEVCGSAVHPHECNYTLIYKFWGLRDSCLFQWWSLWQSIHRRLIKGFDVLEEHTVFRFRVAVRVHPPEPSH